MYVPVCGTNARTLTFDLLFTYIYIYIYIFWRMYGLLQVRIYSIYTINHTGIRLPPWYVILPWVSMIFFHSRVTGACCLVNTDLIMRVHVRITTTTLNNCCTRENIKQNKTQQNKTKQNNNGTRRVRQLALGCESS